MTNTVPSPRDTKILPFPKMDESLKSGGGGGTFDGMEARIAKLEAKSEAFEKRFDNIDAQLTRIEDKIPTEWMMAKVVFYVMAAIMAAAIFGPRLTTIVTAGSQ